MTVDEPESSGDGPRRRRGRGRFRLVSPSGAEVVRPEKLARKDRLKAMIPSAFTLVNMLCGFTSIRAAHSGDFEIAAVLVAVAILFDIFDGTVARAVRAITPFGLQFDSLADLVSFGVAPAVLLYSWSLHDLGPLGWALACYWLACAAFRLGRFNVTIDPLSDKRYFIGLASPGAAGVVIASVFAFDGEFAGTGWILPIAVAVVPATLMATSFRFVSFRFLVAPRRDKVWMTVAAVAALVVGFAVVPAATGLVIAYGYLLVSPLGRITRPLRLRLSPDASVPPPMPIFPPVFFLVPPDDDLDDEDPDDEDPDDDDPDGEEGQVPGEGALDGTDRR